MVSARYSLLAPRAALSDMTAAIPLFSAGCGCWYVSLCITPSKSHSTFQCGAIWSGDNQQSLRGWMPVQCKHCQWEHVPCSDDDDQTNWWFGIHITNSHLPWAWNAKWIDTVFIKISFVVSSSWALLGRRWNCRAVSAELDPASLLETEVKNWQEWIKEECRSRLHDAQSSTVVKLIQSLERWGLSC